MNVQGIKSGYAFSRNPIILRESFPIDNPNKIPDGRCEIIYAGTTIYEGRFSPPLSMNVAEIADAFVTFFNEPPEGNISPIWQIEDTGDMCDRELSCLFEFDGYEAEYNCIVIPGGISRQNFKRLLQLNKDIFQERFFNPKGNFFLTTRTASLRIVMKETELYPLYFFPRRTGDLIRIVERTNGSIYENDSFDEGVAVLDVAALRRYFAEQEQVLSSVFDVYYNSNFSCRIVVERCDPTRERYRLKFRNSLGVFEIIELTGELSITPEYTDADESQFKRYDTRTTEFFTDRERVERKQSISVETGVKRPDEIRFLMDMLGSEEVYLLDLTPLPIKVIPSVEELTYRPRPESPQKFTVKLEISSSEENIMQDIIDGSENRKPRIFSKQFSKQFN